MTREEREEIESKIDELQNKLKDAALEEKLGALKSHKEYVGKCYKVEEKDYYNFGKEHEKYTTYYKVISEVSENEYHVECLEFTLPLKYEYSEKLMRVYDRYPDAEIECEPFVIMDEGFFCNVGTGNKKMVQELIEVTPEEFQSAMDKCYKQFVEFTSRMDLSDEILTR